MKDLRKTNSLREKLNIIEKMDLGKGKPIEITVNYNLDHTKENDEKVIGYFQEIRRIDLCLIGSGRYPYLIYYGEKSKKKDSEKEICVDHIMNIHQLK